MCATSLFHSKTVEEHTVLSIFYVLSGIEYNGCVMDTAQLPKINFSDTDHSDTADHSEQKSDQDKTDKGHQSSGRDHVEKSDAGDEHGNQSSGGNIKLVDVPVQERGENELSVSLCASNTCDDDSDVFHDRAVEDCSLLSLHDISDNFKCDGKNSRRKADKPRKRRRESDHDENNSALEGRKIGKNCDISTNESELCGMDLEQKTKSQMLVNKENLFASNQHSQLDLSLPGSPNETDNTQSVISLLSPQVPEDLSVKPGICDKQSSSPFHSELLQASPGHSSRNTVPTSMLQTQRTPTSVQELEEVMSKHLPSMKDMDQLSLKPKDNCRNLSSFQKQKSTIQWVGSQTTVHDSLPASTLLRNLYANRESVIRSSSSRPSCYPCSDLTVPSTTTSSMTMLTPPGVEGFKDQMYIPQISLPSKNLSVFSTSPLSVSLPSSLTDSYSMTPPSSVSPQEKGQSPFQDPSFNDPCGVSMGSVVISSSNHNRTSAGKMYSFPPMIASSMDYDQEKSTYLSVPHYHNGAVASVVDSYHYFPNNVGGSTGILANESKSAGPWYPSPFSS
ncbi:hypothetical protein ACJMK2_036855 [Sinanodonta woodiana]|uniref:Uncharacterized protein n=1 Tax=Sinanodonta woodiana TaxID=1069815 RepID=A0ABD3WJR0_SINWO